MTIEVADIRRVVREIPLDTDDSDLQPFVDTAALIRSESLAGSGLSLGRLSLIELYLAAHFCYLSVANGGVTETKQGQSLDRYREVDKTLTGLSSTVYGQTALSLDPTNTLALATSTKRALFKVVGSARQCKTTVCP